MADPIDLFADLGIDAPASKRPAQPKAPTLDPFTDLGIELKPAPEAKATGDLPGVALGAGLINGVPIVGPALLSGAQKAAAGAESLISGTKYADELKRVQDRTAVAARENSGLSTAGNIAGATAGYVAGGVPTMGAKALGYVGGMVPRMLAGGASNMLIGGTDAAVRGESPIVGGALGLVGGAAAPVFGGVAGAAANKLTQGVQYLMPTGIEGVSRPAANLINKAIAADDPAAIRAALAQTGELGMLADAGPSVTGLTGALALKPGESKSIVENALMGRAKGSNDRVAGQLNESLGPAYDPNMVARDIEQTRDSVARPLYRTAHDNAPPVEAQSVLDEIDNHLKFAEGNEKKALQTTRDMITEKVEAPVLNPDGTQAMVPGSSVRNKPRANDPTKGPAPISLHDFVRNWGGIKDEHGELDALGLGKLANPKGMSLDDMRRNAAEQGYLGANIDDAMAHTYATDLLDALEKGKKVFSVHDQDRIGIQKPRGRDPSNGWSAGEMVPQVETQTVPKSGSRNLHNIRQELDNVIEHDAPGLGVPASAVSRSQDSLKAVRAKLDQVLKGQVPGMSEADAKFAALAERQNAVERGYQKVLGANGPHPDTYAADRAAQAPGVNIAENMGIRARIDRMFGTGTQRDAVTLNKLLAGGEDGYSAANLKTAFGEQPVNKLLDTLNRERTFSNTTNEVVQNSATARRTAAGKMLDDSSPGTLNLTGATAAGIGAQAAKKWIADPLVAMILRTSSEPMRAEMARVLTSQGQTRDQVLTKLLALHARQNTISATGQALSNFASAGTNRLTMGATGTSRP